MGGGRGGLPDTKRGGGGSPLQVRYTKSGGGGGGGQFASGPLRKVGGGSDVSSPIGVWGEAPEASQAGTRTT